MKRRFGLIFKAAGMILVCAALALFGWNQWESYRAGEAASEVLAQLEAAVLEESSADTAEDAAEDTEEDGEEDGEEDTTDSSATEEASDSGSDAEGLYVGGYSYMGYLYIPTIDLKLPVMTSWSYEALMISPCRYTGSVATDDLVIAAHNYSQHFWNIQYLTEGAPVYFTDWEGETVAYEVSLVETLSPYAIEEMTDSGYALTLFTCTYGGQSRVTVRCDRVSLLD